MKIILMVIGILSIGFTSAFAFHSAADNTYCFFTIFPDKRVETCNWEWIFDKPIDIEKPTTIHQGEDESYSDFMLRLFDLVETLTPGFVPEEKEPLVPDPVMEQIEKAREEVAEKEKLLDELKVFCGYGQDGFKAFQHQIQFESLERLFYDIHKWEYAKKELNKAYETCRAMKNYKDRLVQWEDYPGIDEAKEIYKSTTTIHDAFGSFGATIWNNRELTDHERLQSIEEAEEFQCSIVGKQRGLCVPTDFVDTSIPKHKFDKACQFNPVTQRVDLCPQASLALYNAQAIKDLEDAKSKLCNDTYKKTSYGLSSKDGWAWALVDGTCDKYVDGLEVARGDYSREQWKGQTVNNCPDCKQFKE